MTLQEKLAIEFQRQLTGFVAKTYIQAQNNIRKNATDVYMKHFPVIQGIRFVLHLHRLAKLYNKKRLKQLASIFMKYEMDDVFNLYAKKVGKRKNF